MSSTLTPNIFGGQSGGGGGGAVTSVNGQVGAVALDTDDIPEGSTNRYLTDERVEDIIGTKVVAGTNVTVTYNDTTGETTIAATGGGGGGVAWGDITGTLSDQTDLQNALNNKVGLTGDQAITGIKTFSNQTNFSVQSVFNEGFLVNGTFRTGGVVVTEADLDANGVLEVDELQIVLSGTWTLPIKGFRVAGLTTGVINLRVKNFSSNDITLQYLASAPVATKERIITQNAQDYVFIGSGNGQILDIVFQIGTGFAQEGWFVKDSQYPNYSEGNNYSVLQKRADRWVMATNLENTLGAVVLDWNGPLPSMPRGLRTGDYGGTVNADNTFSNVGTNSFLAEFRSSENRALIIHYTANTSTLLGTTLSDSSSLGVEPFGEAKTFIDPTYKYSMSWDSNDYKTFFGNHRLFLGGNQSAVSEADMVSVDGQIVQAIEVAGSVNNIGRTRILPSATTSGLFYDSIINTSLSNFQNELFGLGTGNTLPGSGMATMGFQGQVWQLSKITDDGDTGWAYNFSDEAFYRFQIGGDAMYTFQFKNTSGAIVFGMNGVNPVVNSGAVQSLSLTATGSYLTFIDESGNFIYIPTYA